MTRRTQRVGESMREAIGELIQRHVKDPRIGFVTITAVRVTPDLSKADVYYTVLGDDDARRDTQSGLESAAPFLRTETGRRVRLKTLPELRFHFDDTMDHGQRVDELIREIHQDAPQRGVDLPRLAEPVEAALDRAARALEASSAVAVACHIGPDGDALGSILAVAIALRNLGKEVVAGWGSDPIEVPAQYAFLPGQHLLVPPDRFEVADAALAIDCASADRLELVLDRMEQARVLVNIDHHVSNTRFGNINVVDETSSSSAELVLQLIDRLGAEIDTDIATCLYAGVVTDTGRFGYSAVTPRTHAVAAYLIDRGVRVDEVSRAIFESLPYGYLKTLGSVLERSRLLDDPPFVVSYLTQADLDEAGVSMDETEEVINVLRSIRESDVAAVLKELEGGAWKVSLRSKGSTDVGAIASHLGGGGHRLAAGFTSDSDLEATISRLHGILRDGVPSP